MEIKKYKSKDCTTMAEIFFNTVHTVNAKDYSKAQLDVWANGTVDIPAWNESFLKHNTLVAKLNGIIVGFGDMDSEGYLDRLYVHKDYQAQGVGTAIVKELERQAILSGIMHFTTHASITAKPFFEKHAYHVVRKNTVIRNKIELTNFVMEKGYCMLRRNKCRLI